MKKSKTKKRSKKRIRKKSKKGIGNLLIFWTVVVLVAIGFIMIFSSSSYSAYFEYDGDRYKIVKKQIMWVIMGFTAMYITLNFNYHYYKKLTKPIYITVFVLLLFVIIGGKLGLSIVPNIKGATRWIYIGPLSIQPSELAKYAIVITLATLMDRRKNSITDFKYGTLFYVGVGVSMAGLVFLQNSLSVTIIIMAVTLIMIFVAGGQPEHVFSVGITGFIGAIGYIFSTPFRRARFLNFLNPWEDASDVGYQLIHSLYAIGSGGFWGVGLGQSKQKALYIPEPYNDFIFSIVIEEIGFLGGMLIIGLFVVLIVAGISVAVNAKDMYGRLLATGIISVVAVQLIINVAVVTGSMPVTGIPMPFISYGGTSMVFIMAAMGIVLNIAKVSKAAEKKELA
ncbi:MAG: putative lipid II flippase FtsW [Clostridium sp.]|nr:putative lipid II flippase FtsW [Clostridium sp.]